MARVKISRDFPVRVDVNTTKTYPFGWEGEIEDLATAFKAVDGGFGSFVGEAPARPKEDDKPKEDEDPAKVAIPEGYADMSAAELVKLARRLGAAPDVKTKDPALEFIAKVAAERKGSLV